MAERWGRLRVIGLYSCNKLTGPLEVQPAPLFAGEFTGTLVQDEVDGDLAG